jgi:ATP-dependent DNA helicase RecG
MGSNNILETPVEFLKGVGPQRAQLLKTELNIHTFEDLLQHFPFRYVDRSKFYSIAEVNDTVAYIQTKGLIIKTETLGEKRTKRFVATLKDHTGTIELVWFQGLKWVSELVKAGEQYVVFGKPTDFKGKFSFSHPEIESYDHYMQMGTEGLHGIYSSTERLRNFGMDSKGMLKLMRQLLHQLHGHLPEYLPSYLIQQNKFVSREVAWRNIHLPANANELKEAEFRLKFEELFVIQMRLLKIKTNRNLVYRGMVFGKVGNYFNTFYNDYLPYELTGAQKRVIKEIRSDMGSGKQMNRLLQGDVGSGKTVVSLICMLIALDNDYQSCLMAPTEILANQHFTTITELLGNMPVKVGLLTGSTTKKQRAVLFDQLLNGELHLLIGTHALIEEKVQFQNLGFVVIDEQHRFGVEQRSKLWSKSQQYVPHVLVMTATPIPRTLAMTVYGDLDISIIDELPPGRKPIMTVHRYDDRRLDVYEFIRNQIAAGRQAYIVYPLIEESEKLDYKNLMDGYDMVLNRFPIPQYQISIVHGKMKAKTKDWEMQRFVNGTTQIMVATTVIEVGVNVPNASIMLIESVERFGLSQLHQLRGRVGRGAEQSYCILMSSHKLSREARMRIDTMVRTNDGFEIAEVDLKLRGPGNIEGTQQSGVIDLKLTNISQDQEIIELARATANNIMEKDAALQMPEHLPLLNFLQQNSKSKSNWSRIS